MTEEELTEFLTQSNYIENERSQQAHEDARVVSAGRLVGPYDRGSGFVRAVPIADATNRITSRSSPVPGRAAASLGCAFTSAPPRMQSEVISCLPMGGIP